MLATTVVHVACAAALAIAPHEVHLGSLTASTPTLALVDATETNAAADADATVDADADADDPTTPEPTVGPAAADDNAALRERNQKLTARMHKGEEWMIGGRIGVGVSAVPVLIGVGALVGYGLRVKAHRASAGLLPHPTHRLRNVGIGFLVVGAAGMTVSAVFAGLGFKEVQEARAGRVGLSLGPGMAGLTYSGRF